MTIVNLIPTTVDVTPNDIATSIPFNCERCPVAAALGRVLRPDLHAAVSYHYIEVHGEHLTDRVDVPTPRVVRDWLIGYDQGRDAPAFTFEVGLPRSVLR